VPRRLRVAGPPADAPGGATMASPSSGMLAAGVVGSTFTPFWLLGRSSWSILDDRTFALVPFSVDIVGADSSEPVDCRLGDPVPCVTSRLRPTRLLAETASLDGPFPRVRCAEIGDPGRSRVGLRGSKSGRDSSVGLEFEYGRTSDFHIDLGLGRTGVTSAATLFVDMGRG
jgi:hypothetical protein